MDTEKKSYCARVDVGVVYDCYAELMWSRCKYYEDEPARNFCKWYSAQPAISRYSGCRCKEAIEEVERDKIITGGIG